MTKLTCIAALAAAGAALLAPAITHAYPDYSSTPWALLTQSADKAISIYAKPPLRVSNNPGNRMLWVKYIQQSDPSVVVMLNEFDCQGHYRRMAATHYADRNQSDVVWREGQGEWNYIRPDSAAEDQQRFACR